jgi:hypothetical protein
MQRLLKILPMLIILLSSANLYAHVGSADVYYEGDAGPYHLFVTVRLPKVIPGIAEMQVRSASPGVDTMRIVLLRLTGPGSQFPPVPDLAARSKDDPQFFVGKLWLMEYGALQVRIEAEGSKGKASLSVPIASFAQEPLPINPVLRMSAGVFLILLMLSVVPMIGGLVRESAVPQGEMPPAVNRRRSKVVMVVVLAGVIVVLFLNRTWWQSEAATYQRAIDLLKPPPAEVKLENGNHLLIRPAAQLLLPIAGSGRDTREVKMDEVIADHGHLMHLFLLKMPAMDVMWHLHPNRVNGGFLETLPAMQAGNYKVFADIVDKDGFPWTMVGSVELPNIPGSPAVEDDSEWKGDGLQFPVHENPVALLPDGARVVWERGGQPIRANVPGSLKFRVEDKNGLPAADLQPYMGMVSHTEVVCTDLSVFAHLHSNGSVSMAALDLAQTGLSSLAPLGAPPHSMDMSHAAPVSPKFDIPYGFPHAGNYRVFVQIKRHDKVQTAAFDALVQ